MLEELINLGIAKELIVVIISALPVIELRGALPVAINVFNMPWYWAYCLAVIGNMLPVPILLLFFESLARIVSKVEIGKKLVDWVFRHTRRHEKMIQKYEWLGLMLFVAIPLPMTGAWTGSIIAFILGMRFTYAFLSIFCGVIIAGAIVTSLCLLGWLGAAIAGIVLSAIAVVGWWRA
ncbi:MAG: small multi-drug export protein [Dehalococcoidia bacterium]|nr:small multi-drug export protein [Dehalococcoidia bacterium]